MHVYCGWLQVAAYPMLNDTGFRMVLILGCMQVWLQPVLGNRYTGRRIFRTY
eukprot:COSAG01_NODE_39054_length_481_cov_3.049738_1_plen_51_part_01